MLPIFETQKDIAIIYCTECGESLDDFCFSEMVNDLNKIRIHHDKCKKEKRFNGDFCSKLFIAEPIEPDDDDECSNITTNHLSNRSLSFETNHRHL